MSALRPIEVDSDNEVRELNGNFEEIDLTGKFFFLLILSTPFHTRIQLTLIF